MNYLIDIDGTLVCSNNEPVKGAVDWLNELVCRGDGVILITNNTQKSPSDIYRQLKEIGFNIKETDILSCLSATLGTIEKGSGKICYVFGNSKLKGYFTDNGYIVANEESDQHIDAVIVGDDPNLDRDKISYGIRAILDGAIFIALHKKQICKNKDNKIVMDVGGTVAALEYCTQKNALVMGKPSEEFYQMGLNKLNANTSNTIVISDDPITDLISGKRMGMKTAFVKTGTYSNDDVVKNMKEHDRPNYISDKISDFNFE